MAKKLGRFALILLFVEFLDEFVFGVREAAWPLIRDDLNLTYTQIGSLLAIPGVVSSVTEPLFGVWADSGKRRLLTLAGGLVFTVALVLTAVSQSYLPLLLSFILIYPASGAFVSLSQANLMDLAPDHRETNMARWTLAGSVGVVLGPVVLGLFLYFHLGWRALFVALACLSVAIWIWLKRVSTPSTQEPAAYAGLGSGFRQAFSALGQPSILRWLILLQFSDLLLDVLLGYLALYFVDVVGVAPELAAQVVAIWTGAGLVGGFLMIRLLRVMPGITYLRVSALVEVILFPVLLLVPGFWAKAVCVLFLGLISSGWYSILQARLYESLPGRSGTAVAASNISGLVGAFFPLVIGWLAESLGLQIAIWLLWLGPLALIVGLPAKKRLAIIL